ncbi:MULTISPECIES: ferredoxin [unclassified Crossiella]|uniref:ferredoxin n=1 Tax=unclassified Crossiella TaxID=2620835 RepID=UPI001FFF29D2|nr:MULTISPECIES: ferredoxin [unclassified Crossiella]MCK2237384.1 ferredoxin [Crossiella sp. S99.2]MCK2251039.1 ferredoxin [Crossiella sp. S99.1]
MKVLIDQDRCCGAGSCVLAAPEVFDQREEDGIVALLDPTPDDSQRALVDDAVSRCPAAAISVVE